MTPITEPAAILTDERIIEVCEQTSGWLAGAKDSDIIAFARAIEANLRAAIAAPVASEDDERCKECGLHCKPGACIYDDHPAPVGEVVAASKFGSPELQAIIVASAVGAVAAPVEPRQRSPYVLGVKPSDWDAQIAVRIAAPVEQASAEPICWIDPIELRELENGTVAMVVPIQGNAKAGRIPLFEKAALASLPPPQAPATQAADDAARFAEAIALADNAEALYGAVMSHEPDGAAIRASFDAYMAREQVQ